MSSHPSSRSPSPTSPTTTSTSTSHSNPERTKLDTSTPAADTPTDPDVLSSPSALLSAITYPVSYTISGLFRRISVDEAPTPLAKALSANYNGSMSDASLGAYSASAPKRTRSPYQPPALTPLTLLGFKDSTRRRERLLDRSLAEEIRLLVPPRIQLVDQWNLVYSLEQDGASLNRLFGLCERFKGRRGGFVLVVRDGSGMVCCPFPVIPLFTSHDRFFICRYTSKHERLADYAIYGIRCLARIYLIPRIRAHRTTAQGNVSCGARCECHPCPMPPTCHHYHLKIPRTQRESRPSRRQGYRTRTPRPHYPR